MGLAPLCTMAREAAALRELVLASPLDPVPRGTALRTHLTIWSMRRWRRGAGGEGGRSAEEEGSIKQSIDHNRDVRSRRCAGSSSRSVGGLSSPTDRAPRPSLLKVRSHTCSRMIAAPEHG